MNLENKTALELRVKHIDEQIALLTNLKSQCLQKLQGLEFSSKQIQSDDQAALFLNYFRGRDDVYAELWVNNRTGKCGYSPACKNEWVKIICKKPAIKCSECPNQQFFSLDEIANRIYIKIGTGPSVLFNQLKHLAAFQNPEFYRKQKMRFSTHATPRVICCAEIVDGYPFIASRVFR